MPEELDTALRRRCPSSSKEGKKVIRLGCFQVKRMRNGAHTGWSSLPQEFWCQRRVRKFAKQ